MLHLAVLLALATIIATHVATRPDVPLREPFDQQDKAAYLRSVGRGSTDREVVTDTYMFHLQRPPTEAELSKHTTLMEYARRNNDPREPYDAAVIGARLRAEMSQGLVTRASEWERPMGPNAGRIITAYLQHLKRPPTEKELSEQAARMERDASYDDTAMGVALRSSPEFKRASATQSNESDSSMYGLFTDGHVKAHIRDVYAEHVGREPDAATAAFLYKRHVEAELDEAGLVRLVRSIGLVPMAASEVIRVAGVPDPEPRPPACPVPTNLPDPVTSLIDRRNRASLEALCDAA